ncbi:MAG TPA: class I SAM-dependent methyltransferase, partial [Thermodesulfovibrionales bacterium]|nr:class I SAM-dependent methyltransferase [Thermodesulfovibrionales bacterium]
MHPVRKETSVRDMFSIVAPYIDPLDTAFSLGLCHIWRRRLVSTIRRGEHILDLCTGTGEVAKLLVKRIGREGTLTCLDFCEEMLEVAKRKLNPIPVNVSFVVSDVREMRFPE